MIFVGDASNHEHDCHHMFNPEMNYIHNTRDVIWGAHMYYTITMPSLEICNTHEVAIDSKLEGSNYKLEAGKMEAFL